jgi:PleD family two-component response regulator
VFGSIILIYFRSTLLKQKKNDDLLSEKKTVHSYCINKSFIKLKKKTKTIFLKNHSNGAEGMIQEKKADMSLVLMIRPLFHSKNLANALQNQGRKVLVIDATTQLEGDLQYILTLRIKMQVLRLFFKMKFRKKMKNYGCVSFTINHKRG